MKKRMTKLLSASVMALAVVASPAFASADTNETIDYVALGDSLAAGQTPDKQIGDGYADYIANQIAGIGELASFHKEFATPGYTTSQVLEDLKTNVERPDTSSATHKIQEIVQNAEIITLDAGANDLLQVLKPFLETGQMPEQTKIEAALTTVGANTAETLKIIKTINPNADIYLMGYYNPFPYLPSEQQKLLVSLLGNLNNVLMQTAKAFNVTFVPTADSFGQKATSFLPNPKDIHPNEAGYLVLANDFWKSISLYDQVDFKDKVPASVNGEITYLAKKGIVTGDQNGEVRVNDYAKRFESAIMLNNAIIFNKTTAPNPQYKDVTEKTDGYAAIAKLTEQGIFSGSNGNFNPEGTLTRGQLAKIIVEAFDLTGTTGKTFKDVNGHWAADYISILAANHVIQGYPDNTFKPNNKVSRAQLSLVLARVLDAQFKTK